MSKMLKSIHQEVQGLHRAGFVDDVTMRTFDMLCLRPVKQFGPAEIRALRERENVSQPVFALYLNVSKKGGTKMGARRSATELRRNEAAVTGGTQRPANSGLILLIIDDDLIANHAQRRVQPALRLHVIDKAQFRIGRFALQTVAAAAAAAERNAAVHRTQLGLQPDRLRPQ